jgi:glycerol-3-phosphate dehydrogenase subunit B
VIRCDVLVAGGGMAGAIAALAARAAGARVVLVRRAPGATALSSGAVGVAPDAAAASDERLAARRGPLEAARRIAARHPEHPYALVGASLAALPEALAFAAGALGEVLAPPSGRTAWLATPYGSAIPCAMCQHSMVAGDLAAARGPVAVVGLRGHLGWDAALVAHGVTALAAAGAPPAFPVEVEAFMREADAVSRPHELARALEAEGAAEELGVRLRRAVGGRAATALLPPILGISPGARVAQRVAEAAGVAVAETVADVPSVPGLRLHGAIERALAAAEIPVVAADLSGGRPGEVARAGDEEILAGRWVLATGRFVGGGIARRGVLVEAVLGLPVQASESGASGFHLARRPPSTLTARERRAAQPLLAAGVRVDGALRPLDDRGAPAHAGLHAAGAVIGGHEHAADGTGLGVAILTGWLAGRAAASAR